MKRVGKRREMSESFLTAAVLSLSGGLQDAYTYLFRGEVFANAQTGNVVLLAQSVAGGSWSRAVSYLIPLLSFALGIASAETIRFRCQSYRKVHWRQIVLAIEIGLLFMVGFFTREYNLPANAIVSFSCAMQVQTFRKVNGHAFASTMCIGNIRSGTEALCAYCKTRRAAELRRAAQYWGIIFLFAVGAAAGGLTVAAIGPRTIWVSCGLLFLGLCLMFFRSSEKAKIGD